MIKRVSSSIHFTVMKWEKRHNASGISNEGMQFLAMLNLFPQLYIGKWTVGLHLSSRMGFFCAPFTRSTLCAANAQFWTKGEGTSGKYPDRTAPLHYERIPRKQRQRIHCKQSHLQRSCTGAAASFLQVAAIAAFSAGSSLRSSVCLPLYVNQLTI